MLWKGLYIALVAYLISIQVDAVNVNDINTLKKTLLENYDKSTTPISGDKPLNVKVYFYAADVGDLDEKLEKLTTNWELSIYWTDVAMIWDASETGINSTSFDREKVWVPAWDVFNKHSQISYGIDETRYRPVQFSADGKGSFKQVITTETYCDLDVSGFPYDRHTCDIIFFVNKDSVRIKAELREKAKRDFQPYGSWEAIERTYRSYRGGVVVVKLTLDRKPTFILVNLVLPITMLTLLSPLVFLLPNQSGERVGFAITVLLAISVFMTIVAEHIPNKSKPFPLVLTMLFVAYSLIIVVVMGVIVIARIYNLPDHVRIPRPLIWLFRIINCLCCCFRRRRKDGGVTDNEGDLEEKESQSRKVDPADNLTWKDIAWAVDMLCMILFYTLKVVLVVVFIIMINSKNDKENKA